ncbi:hypothetical protein P8452_09844 [Trifolium repens]|nr:hypothetical protein P8452_09844 [Trifolium repens]
MDSETHMKYLEAKVARSRRFGLLKKKRCKLDPGIENIQVQPLSNTYITSVNNEPLKLRKRGRKPKITMPLLPTSSTEISGSRNFQGINASCKESSKDKETTTGSTNTMFRKPLSDITSSHQNQHSISPPLRKLGRPRKITTLPELPINIQTNDIDFAQTSNVVEEVDAEFNPRDLRKTQCINQSTIHDVPLTRKRGRPKKVISDPPKINSQDIDQSNIHNVPLTRKRGRLTKVTNDPPETISQGDINKFQASVQSSVPNITPSQHNDNDINVLSAQALHTYTFRTLPVPTQSITKHNTNFVRSNQVGINLMSKFCDVGQHSQRTTSTDHNDHQQSEVDTSISPLLQHISQKGKATAFAPQANDDFCSSEDESDSDYNPFEYPDSDHDYDSSSGDDNDITNSNQQTAAMCKYLLLCFQLLIVFSIRNLNMFAFICTSQVQ